MRFLYPRFCARLGIWGLFALPIPSVLRMIGYFGVVCASHTQTPAIARVSAAYKFFHTQKLAINWVFETYLRFLYPRFCARLGIWGLFALPIPRRQPLPGYQQLISSPIPRRQPLPGYQQLISSPIPRNWRSIGYLRPIYASHTPRSAYDWVFETDLRFPYPRFCV